VTQTKHCRASPGEHRLAAGRAARIVLAQVRPRCPNFGSVSADVRQVGRQDVDVSRGEASLLDWIAGLSSGDDRVDLPTLPLNYRVEYSGAEGNLSGSGYTPDSLSM
jgi:hypothetical protein